MKLQLNDCYFTLQGEGFNAGRRALFVRMPFCDLDCHWCDTEFNSFKEWTDVKFKDFAASEPADFAVLTGGEPTMHKHTRQVIKLLQLLNFKMIAVETNGHFPIPEGINWVTVSPKRDLGKEKIPYFVSKDAWGKASEFKYVVDDGFDWGILNRHTHIAIADTPYLYLSPEYSKMQEHVSDIIEFIRKRPSWRLSLQTHKWLGIP